MKKIFIFLLFSCAFVMHSQDYTNGNLIVSYNIDTNNSGAYRNLSLQEYTTGKTGVLQARNILEFRNHKMTNNKLKTQLIFKLNQ